MRERTVPICFTKEQIRLIEEYAKERGMMNLSQALEQIIRKARK